MMNKPQSGFTLVEMIVVLVITGIIGGIVAVFIRMPVQGYTDTARRAEMTDIADTALRRISRDIRTALPNSVRITVSGTGIYLEFLPVDGSGRYRAAVVNPATDNPLNFATTDNCFDVLGPMPALAAGDKVVIYNRGIAGVADAYDGTSSSAYVTPTPVCTPEVASTAATIGITAKQFPFKSPGNRFQVINTPVTYVCAPATDAAGNGTGTLMRYWGYPIANLQPTALATLTSVNPGAQLASRVSACNLSYGAVGQRLGMVTLQLTLADSGEKVTLYSSIHVSNVP